MFQFQVLTLLLTTLAITSAGIVPQGQSSVSVKHVGKDFSYSIEETHGMGVDSSSAEQKTMPIIPVVPDVSGVPVGKSDISRPMPAESPEMPSQENKMNEKSVDYQAIPDQTVQMLPSEPRVDTFGPVEPQVKSRSVMDVKMDLMPEHMMRPLEPILKSAVPLPMQPQAKEFVLFNPQTTSMMEKSRIVPYQNLGHEQMKVMHPTYRMMHQGFQYYQPLRYYYPVGMVGLV